MVVRTYSGDATRELVITVVADSEPRLDRAHPVSAGGGWQIDTWRDDLIQALMDRQAMLDIGIRTAPADRVLPDQPWTDIAHRLSRHLGVLDSDKPWVAIRTGERTVALLVQAHRPPSIPPLVDFRDCIESRYDLAASRPAAVALLLPSMASTEPAGPMSDASAPSRHGRPPRR